MLQTICVFLSVLWQTVLVLPTTIFSALPTSSFIAIVLLLLFLASLFSVFSHIFQYGAWGEVKDGNTLGRASPFGFTGRWGGYTDGRLGQVLNWIILDWVKMMDLLKENDILFVHLILVYLY